MKKFWLVYVDDFPYCSILKYSDKEEAEKGVERLARLYEDAKVYLFEPIACCSIEELPIKWEK